ncbi:MAG: multicopper oxidase domain-containing protein [Nitrososphaera sp.]
MKNVLAAGLAAGLFVAGILAGMFVVSGQPEQETAVTIEPTLRRITLIADENVVQVAPDSALHQGGIRYHAMTFNGTIPGPLISVNRGDTVEITLQNQGDIIHSLNFHAAVGPSQVLSEAVRPGESKTWSFVADTPGAFMYHCDGDNLNGIWEHIASGMYGGIVVRSGDEKPVKEFYVVFGELYNTEGDGPFSGAVREIGSFDLDKFIANRPDLILTNGMAYRYIPYFGSASTMQLNNDAERFDVKAGELTRWYIVNAGPRGHVAFNFGAGIINTVDGRPLHDETWSIPPGSAAVIETVFPEKGVYFGNDHDEGRLLSGAGFAVYAK